MLFENPKLDEREQHVCGRIEELRRHLVVGVQPKRWTGVLRRMTEARNMQGSNSIEGYYASRSDVLAVVAGEEPLSADEETREALAGYRDAMTYVLQLAADPFFEHATALIRGLHFILMKYDLAKHPGQWRPGPVYVTAADTGKRVYEGPNVRSVPALMVELVDQLQTEDKDVPCMVRAAMSHLNLVMIHPFSDGNGRMARILQTLLLAREQILSPSFCSIEEYLGRNTPEYYRVLEEVGAGGWYPERDSRPWIRFSLRAHFFQARTLLRRVTEMGNLWELLEAVVAEYDFPDRTMMPLADAALGFAVRNSTYRSIAKISDNLASKDLRRLSDAGFLVTQSSDRRGQYYGASERLKAIYERIREKRPPSEDPFEQEFSPGLSPVTS